MPCVLDLQSATMRASKGQVTSKDQYEKFGRGEFIIFVIIDNRFFSSSSYNLATRILTKNIDDEGIDFQGSLCIA